MRAPAVAFDQVAAPGARVDVFSEGGDYEGSGKVVESFAMPWEVGLFISAVRVQLDDGRVVTRRPQRVMGEGLAR